MRTFSILFVMAVLSGCRTSPTVSQGTFDDFFQRAAHSSKQTGDFGDFFVHQVAHCGGQPVGSAVTELRGSCYYESDREGFAAYLYDVPFSQVQSFLHHVYGDPIGVSTNAMPGGWTGLYGIRPGAALQFFSGMTGTNGVGFIGTRSESHRKP